MREYGQIQSAFWTDPDFRDLTDQARILAAYLLTGPCTNGLGCFYLPIAYLAADLCWTQKKGDETVSELFRKGFLTYCERSRYAFLPNFLKFNPISNANVAKARIKDFEQLPKEFQYFSELARSLQKFGAHFPDEFLNRLETVSKPDPTRPERDPDQKGSLSRFEASSEIESTKAAPINGTPVRFEDVTAILAHLSDAAGKSFRWKHNGKATSHVAEVQRILKRGYTVADAKAVIDQKASEWANDQKMAHCLRPSTLFNLRKFETYLAEAES